MDGGRVASVIKVEMQALVPAIRSDPTPCALAANETSGSCSSMLEKLQSAGASGNSP